MINFNQNFPVFSEINIEFYLVISVVIIGFLGYYFLTSSVRIKNRFIHRIGLEKTKIKWVLFEKLSGFLFFGIIPLAIVVFVFNESIELYGISDKNSRLSIYWIIGLSPILITGSYFNSKKKDNLLIYPQIRILEWDLRLIIISALGWFFYLLAYEFMFRGFLLFVSERNLGVWAAIILNLILYSLAHLHKGSKETFGSIPFGLILCIITLQTGTILVSFILHVVIALSNEWFSIKAHPEMRFN